MEDFNRRTERADFDRTAPGRLFADREFVAVEHEKTKNDQEADLHEKITKIDEEIAHTRTSIDVLVASIAKGRIIKGAEELKMKLEEEAGLAKNELLQEIASLEAEKNALERELGAL